MTTPELIVAILGTSAVTGVISSLVTWARSRCSDRVVVEAQITAQAGALIDSMTDVINALRAELALTRDDLHAARTEITSLQARITHLEGLLAAQRP